MRLYFAGRIFYKPMINRAIRAGLFLALCVPLVSVYCQSQALSKEQIVQIAVGEFQKLGGNLQQRIIVFDINNGKWERHFATIDRDLLAKFEVLLDKDYQAVCFAPKPRVSKEAKNIWVFIDRITGYVLALYVEK